MALAYKINDKYQAFLLLAIMMRMMVVMSLVRGKISSILRLNINYRKRCSTHSAKSRLLSFAPRGKLHWTTVVCILH